MKVDMPLNKETETKPDNQGFPETKNGGVSLTFNLEIIFYYHVDPFFLDVTEVISFFVTVTLLSIINPNQVLMMYQKKEMQLQFSK